jgi:hypothetical protein
VSPPAFWVCEPIYLKRSLPSLSSPSIVRASRFLGSPTDRSVGAAFEVVDSVVDSVANSVVDSVANSVVDTEVVSILHRVGIVAAHWVPSLPIAAAVAIVARLVRFPGLADRPS